MTKSIVSRIWLAGLVLIALGVVVALVAGAVGVPGVDSDDVQNRQYLLNEMSRSTGGVLGIVALIALSIGAMIQFVGWVLGMLTTATAGQWGWFAALLVLGAVGLGFFVMVAYVFRGPAGRRVAQALTPA